MAHYENSLAAIIGELSKANGYLESEKVVIQNMKQQVKEGLPAPVIAENLKKLYTFLTKQVQQKNNSSDTVNLKYAAAYLRTLITTPYWESWIRIA